MVYGLHKLKRDCNSKKCRCSLRVWSVRLVLGKSARSIEEVHYFPEHVLSVFNHFQFLHCQNDKSSTYSPGQQIYEMKDNLTYTVINEKESGKSIGAHRSKLKIPWLAENSI